MRTCVNFAHRGASGVCPENTMAAFVKAIELGATGIETDVQMTRDGRLVLIHDETLQRTAGVSGWVKDFTLDELRQLDAGAWYGEEFRGEKIPVLEELLELAKRHDLVLNLELKNGHVSYPGMEERTAEIVRRFRMCGQVIISSFNHYSLVLMKQAAPEIETAVLYMEGLYEPWVYARRIGASALHPYRLAVTPAWVQEAGKWGIRYHPFTVNEESEMRTMLDAGVSGIITDYPDRLAALLA
ncbi:glycerophosphoryl diester phosphodiesterase [Insulibacter thermoxylanivorax]|uniref:Glycerophosphoryl diester phosphodiesterase n=1 Tax=Insulibacter thermoxylanivorax TaxID=2749268 RepID=A0A916QDM2_9BACL|nr:glycerophosphodiester phosphodiesterase [Insulibacter thermoxylanivorax]GFR37128.1 glycerophosphoryl diester phosphodiesterase [Insulibacter thermoxylanivorax]